MSTSLPSSALRRTRIAIMRWIDTRSGGNDTEHASPQGIDWTRVLPFILLHVACVGVWWVGVSTTALIVALGLYGLRMFAITGFYHRYFSHKAFRTSRPMQFIFAVIGAMSVQRGPLCWAAHHRHHHRHSDQPADLHSPVQHSFWHSHLVWFLRRDAFATQHAAVADLAQFPELRWLDRFDTLVPLILAAALYALGAWLESTHPSLGTSGAQLLIWGFFVSTVVLLHVTVSVNSLAHRVGSRRFDTRDNSRNNFWLALLTFGEGWHNNHHFFPGSARQGFRWWEVDITYYGLRLLALVGLIWDLKPAPPSRQHLGVK